MEFKPLVRDKTITSFDEWNSIIVQFSDVNFGNIDNECLGKLLCILFRVFRQCTFFRKDFYADTKAKVILSSLLIH